MGLKITQVDAFTSQPFRGNPAAVCIPAAGRWELDAAGGARDESLRDGFPAPPE